MERNGAMFPFTGLQEKWVMPCTSNSCLLPKKDIEGLKRQRVKTIGAVPHKRAMLSWVPASIGSTPRSSCRVTKHPEQLRQLYGGAGVAMAHTSVVIQQEQVLYWSRITVMQQRGCFNCWIKAWKVPGECYWCVLFQNHCDFENLHSLISTRYKCSVYIVYWWACMFWEGVCIGTLWWIYLNCFFERKKKEQV